MWVEKTYLKNAGTIAKGDYILINDRPCKVLALFPYKTTSKLIVCGFVAMDIFTGREYKYAKPASDNCDVPHVNITEYQVTGIRENGSLTLVNEYGEARADLKLPTDGLVRLIKHTFSMNNRLAVKVISAMGEERICSARYYRII